MKHFGAIDGLRAWMAWWVVCQHVLQLSGMDLLFPGPAVRILTMGGLAVAVFVIISGFVIAHLCLSRDDPYGPYMARRALRLYPLYLVALAAALALRPVYFAVISSAPWIDPGNAAAVLQERHNLPTHLFLHLTLLHGVVPNAILDNSYAAILAPAWSLSLEWQFYLLAPALVATVAGRNRRGWLLVAALTLAMVGAYGAHPEEQWGYPAFLPLAIGFFMIGIATRLFMAEMPFRQLWPALAVAALNIVLYCRSYTGGHLLVALTPIAIWGLFVLLCFDHPRLPRLGRWRFARKLFDAPPIVALGQWSYSTYLLHVPLFVFTLGVARSLGMPVQQSAYFWCLLGGCILLVPLSWLSYTWIERGLMNLGTRYFIPTERRV